MNKEINNEKNGKKQKSKMNFISIIIFVVLMVSVAAFCANELIRFIVTARSQTADRVVEEASDTTMVDKANENAQFRNELDAVARQYDDESGCIYKVNKDSEGNEYCTIVTAYNTKVKELNIPSELSKEKYPVRYIGEDAFGEEISYEKIIIPDTVVGIGDGAFKNLNGLNEIVIGDNVIEFGEDVFGESSELTVVCNKDCAAYQYAIDNNIKVKVEELEKKQ